MDLTQEKFITAEEESSLLTTVQDHCRRNPFDVAAKVDLMLYQLLSLTGLRISEALALTWKDVGPDYILIRKAKNTARIVEGKKKKDKSRSVDIGRILVGHLQKWKEENPFADSKWLFNTSVGQYKRTNAHERLKEWLSQANLRSSISCHCFRHTYATKLLNAGLPIPYVAKQLGHSNITITSVYLHYTAQAKEKLQVAF